MTTLKIEAGKAYRTRDGRRVHITGIAGDGTYPVFGRLQGSNISRAWTLAGALVHGKESPLDLTEEWTGGE